jgi:flagellar M-ring protein FliF
VVNYKSAAQGADGQPGKPAPLPPQEITQINNLVKESMGFNQQRGDTVNVVNAAFSESKVDADIPLWKDPDNVSMAKSLLKNLIVFGLAFYLVFGVLRPLLRDLVKPPERPPHMAGAAGEGEARGMPGAAPDVVYTDVLTKVKDFSKANPKVTADIVKEWMGKE